MGTFVESRGARVGQEYVMVSLDYSTNRLGLRLDNSRHEEEVAYSPTDDGGGQL